MSRLGQAIITGRRLSLGYIGLLGALAIGNLFGINEKKDEQDSLLQQETQEHGQEKNREKYGSINNPPKVTFDQIKKDVAQLNTVRNYNLTSEGLVAVVRTVYFEGSYDSDVDNNNELLESYKGIAQVILNRFLYDTCSEKSPHVNLKCKTDEQYRFGGEKGVEGIIRKEVLGVHQFSCVDDHPYFYEKSSLDDGLNSRTYFGKKKDNKNVHDLNVKRLRFAYQAVIGVLDDSNPGRTGKAFFYKNTGASDQVWDKVQAFMDVSDNCSQLKYSVPAATQVLIDDKSKRVHCVIETSYDRDKTIEIGGHSYYALVPKKTEIVFDNLHVMTYVNGKEK